jgi:5-methylcytosine-specific restriction endonuclease McrA
VASKAVRRGVTPWRSANSRKETIVVLSESTLVLNKNWLPVDITTVLNALCKVYEGAARVINPDDYSMHDFDSWSKVAVAPEYPVVRTATLSIPIPEVIVLARYGNVPQRGVAFSRRNLYKRDKYTCQYCGKSASTEELTIDHVLPRSRGGISSWTNCAVACIRCNSIKANKTPAEARMILRSTPVKPDWVPRLVLGRMSYKPSWEKFVSEAYWNIELEA